VNLPYARGLFATEWLPLDNDVAGIPVGYWRSVGCSLNTFAVESMIGHAGGSGGQRSFRFSHRSNNRRKTLAVLAKADDFSAWRNTLPPGHAWGMAISKAFGTIVCEVWKFPSPPPAPSPFIA